MIALLLLTVSMPPTNAADRRSVPVADRIRYSSARDETGSLQFDIPMGLPITSEIMDSLDPTAARSAYYASQGNRPPQPERLRLENERLQAQHETFPAAGTPRRRLRTGFQDPFPQGSRVILHSLQNSADYNGRTGTVLAPFVGKSGGEGYRVKLDPNRLTSRDTSEERAYAAKNMKIAAPACLERGAKLEQQNADRRAQLSTLRAAREAQTEDRRDEYIERRRAEITSAAVEARRAEARTRKEKCRFHSGMFGMLMIAGIVLMLTHEAESKYWEIGLCFVVMVGGCVICAFGIARCL